ncbi:unnamed protein product, partial [Amoebophrya sp. A120]
MLARVSTLGRRQLCFRPKNAPPKKFQNRLGFLVVAGSSLAAPPKHARRVAWRGGQPVRWAGFFAWASLLPRARAWARRQAVEAPQKFRSGSGSWLRPPVAQPREKQAA